MSAESLGLDRTVRRTGSLLESIGHNDRAVALRNLKRLRLGDSRIQVDEEFVNRYLTLRQVRGQRCRITSRDLLGCTQEQSSNTHLMRKLWILPKHLKPNLDSEIDEALLVDASLLATTPPGVITEDVWVVDQACPQASLGHGAFEWVTGVSVKYTIPTGDASLHTSITEENNHTYDSLGSFDETASQRSESVADNSSSARPPPSRLLSNAYTEPLQAEDVFEGIARRTKAASAFGRFYSEDQQDTSTVEFWLRSYSAHLKACYLKFEGGFGRTLEDGSQATDNFTDTLAPHVRQYLRFVVNCLVVAPCYQCLGKLTHHFKQIRTFAPDLVPEVVSALEVLQKDLQLERPH